MQKRKKLALSRSSYLFKAYVKLPLICDGGEGGYRICLFFPILIKLLVNLK